MGLMRKVKNYPEMGAPNKITLNYCYSYYNFKAWINLVSEDRNLYWDRFFFFRFYCIRVKSIPRWTFRIEGMKSIFWSEYELPFSSRLFWSKWLAKQTTKKKHEISGILSVEFTPTRFCFYKQLIFGVNVRVA